MKLALLCEDIPYEGGTMKAGSLMPILDPSTSNMPWMADDGWVLIESPSGPMWVGPLSLSNPD